MPRFSDRIGVTQPPTLTRDGMSQELLTSLWNAIHSILFGDGVHRGWWHHCVTEIYVELHWSLDEMTYMEAVEANNLKRWFFDKSLSWYETYNFIEFVVPSFDKFNGHEEGLTEELFNDVFTREGSPYRFVGGELTEIVDPVEIAAIEEAQQAGDDFAGARTHINKALEFISQRPEPDYRNSISESISAVESTLKVLTELDHADLSEALKAFANAYPIHGALYSGLNSLYGYTSNEHGIRHGLLDQDANVGYAEAKFMVVACAAFMNYLIAREA